MEDTVAPQTLAELYVEELKDLYSAENQILKALPKLIKAAMHEELKDAFEAHRRQTEQHVGRLEQIFKELDESPKGKKCHGMQGVLEEGAELIQEKPEPAVLDAGLISAAQHVEHYEMAGYGSVRTWAEKLGYHNQAALLQQTLDEERMTDELLTRLAERSVNADAAAEVEVGRGNVELADVVQRKPATRSPASKRTPPTTSRRR
jgi:ferritin-like metal-binding protein YciE